HPPAVRPGRYLALLPLGRLPELPHGRALHSRGRSSFSRLVRATTTRTAMPDAATFCWNGTFWSTVRNPSKPSASISLRSSALRFLHHPSTTTALTSCSATSLLC